MAATQLIRIRDNEVNGNARGEQNTRAKCNCVDDKGEDAILKRENRANPNIPPQISTSLQQKTSYSNACLPCNQPAKEKRSRGKNNGIVHSTARNLEVTSKLLAEIASNRTKERSRSNTTTSSSGSYRLSTCLLRPSSLICIKIIVVILLMDNIPGIDPSELSKTVCNYLEHRRNCFKKIEDNRLSNGTFCRGEFDGYMCWMDSLPGSVTMPCPLLQEDDDIFNNTRVGYRYCLGNGSWHRIWNADKKEITIWHHKSECNVFPNSTFEYAEDLDSGSNILVNFRIMYSIGYGVSLVCLVIALLLLAFFKKLHCTRNYIHMNLMVSFVIRYVVILIKDSVLVSYYDLDSLHTTDSYPAVDDLQQYCDEYGGTWVLTRCRLVMTLMHYAITANYFWLLAEGLYLQMLLVFVMSENKYFPAFMVFGWGAPWISVLIWLVLRLNYENVGCWDMNDKMHVWWTIRVPIIISILINFLIFLNIVRLIVSKLNANHSMAQYDYKLRLAKSTLALIPLLGIHYIVFLVLTEEISKNTTAKHLKLGFDMFLTSIQGTLVSVLYCFLNGEVRAEVRKAWRDWRNRKGLPRNASRLRKGSTLPSTNQSTSITYYSRHSTTGADCMLQDGNHQSPIMLKAECYDTTTCQVRNSLIELKSDHDDIGNGNGMSFEMTCRMGGGHTPIAGNNNSENGNHVIPLAEKSLLDQEDT